MLKCDITYNYASDMKKPFMFGIKDFIDTESNGALVTLI